MPYVLNLVLVVPSMAILGVMTMISAHALASGDSSAGWYILATTAFGFLSTLTTLLFQRNMDTRRRRWDLEDRLAKTEEALRVANDEIRTKLNSVGDQAEAAYRAGNDASRKIEDNQAAIRENQDAIHADRHTILKNQDAIKDTQEVLGRLADHVANGKNGGQGDC